MVPVVPAALTAGVGPDVYGAIADTRMVAVKVTERARLRQIRNFACNGIPHQFTAATAATSRVVLLAGTKRRNVHTWEAWEIGDTIPVETPYLDKDLLDLTSMATLVHDHAELRRMAEPCMGEASGVCGLPLLGLAARQDGAWLCTWPRQLALRRDSLPFVH